MDLKSVIVKDMILEVFNNVNTRLLADATTWFAINAKPLHSLYGVSPYVINYLEENPTHYPNAVTIEPVKVFKGGEYATVIINRLVIVTDYPREDNLTDRYELTVRPILYPAYELFLECLSQHPKFAEWGDPNRIQHEMSVIPGWQPADSRLEQYLDAIELTGLKFSITQILNC